MAKSKNGGSRAFIRGRIGSDVYSVGKNGQGARQQVVRSLAVQVSNPRTQSQMFGRMLMSTVMQAVSALSPIIDHSFAGLPSGQPSISEFIRRNYALLKAEAIAHPDGNAAFNFSKYQEKGIQGGKYVISDGQLTLPAGVRGAGEYIIIELPADNATVGGLKSVMGDSEDRYFTIVLIASVGGCFYLRARLKSGLSDSTSITAENVASLFEFEGNTAADVVFNSNTIYIQMPAAGDFSGTFMCSGLIMSDKVNGSWEHNACTLDTEDYGMRSADDALATYPTGTAQFLNGGDL